MGIIKETLFDTSFSEKKVIVKDILKYRLNKDKNRSADSLEAVNGLIKDDLFMDNFELLFTGKIVVCCADDSGRLVYDMLKGLKGAKIYAFCEKYPDHWKKVNGKEDFMGSPVIGLEECAGLFKSGDAVLIMATNSRKKEDYLLTIENEYTCINPIVSWTGFLTAVHYNIEDQRFSESFREKYRWKNELKTRNAMWDFYYKCSETMMKDDLILVYSPPKTGSSSIYKSIKDMGRNVVHIHNISGYSSRNLGYFDFYRDFFGYWIKTIPDKKSIKVISLVRDPVARSISQVFQMIEMDHIKTPAREKNITDEVYDRLSDDTADGMGEMFEWFVKEPGQTFGTDIYNYDFDREKGYLIIDRGNVKLLIMTLEKLNSNVGIVGDFCGISGFKLKRTNDAQSKIYRNLYRSTLNKIRVPDKILDFYYNNNKAMDYFYDRTDVEKFRKKWDRK